MKEYAVAVKYQTSLENKPRTMYVVQGTEEIERETPQRIFIDRIPKKWLTQNIDDATLYDEAGAREACLDAFGIIRNAIRDAWVVKTQREVKK